MAVFNRMETLPPLGTREGPQLDFKAVLNRTKTGSTDYFELAKDIAAMASAFGGTVLIGACENKSTGQVVTYKPLSAVEAEEVVKAYDKAMRDRCVPQPLIDPGTIPHEGGFVVAIHIHPVLDRPVGVKTKVVDGEKFGDDGAYVFPVRLSTHAISFTPEKLPMLLNPAIRRTVILLEGIPEAERAQLALLTLPFLGGSGRDSVHVSTVYARLDEINLEANIAFFTLLNHTTKAVTPDTVNIPLDDIETIWRESPTEWRIRLSGYFFSHTSRSEYVTRTRAG
jgi:hypothetical protein